jgi:inhibitor of cysteine peptidase
MAEVTVTREQNGGVVPMRVGDTITMHLAENPTTGYAWDIDVLDRGLLEAEAPTYREAGAGVGAGGMKTWKLVARRPGRTRVALKRWRHWEGDASIAERFAVTLDIKG